MTCAIEVGGVSKTFALGTRLPWRRQPRRTIDALIDVTMNVNEGEVFGLVGRNGYGKTTLIKCICSLVEPTRGCIRVLGIDTLRGKGESRRRIGYVGSDERSFYWRLTGRQNLLFFARLQGVDAHLTHRNIAELAKKFDIAALLDRRFHEYSTGNRQRLAIVRALMHAPSILVLDEPTRSLDPFAADALRHALAAWVEEEPRRSILITSHNLSEIEQLSHRVGIMSRGRLLELGTLGELRSRFDDRERVRLWLDGGSPMSATQFEDGAAQDLTISEGPDGTYWLDFRHRPRDSALDSVIRTAIRLGAMILSVDRAAMSLQDIIDRVDNPKERV